MKKLCLVFTLFVYSFSAFSNVPEPLNYTRAFDLSKIQKKHEHLMHALGCDENVFDQKIDDFDDEDFDVESELKAYEQACLSHLQGERRAAKFFYAHMLALDCATVFGGAVIGSSYVDMNSVVGNMAITMAASAVGLCVRDYIKAGYDYFFKAPLLLDQLEEEYVKKQCFIPRAMWPMLKLKFMMGRDNQYEQQKSIDFIKFALGLTVYKNVEKTSVSEVELDAARKQLSRKIDDFFKSYGEYEADEIERLKINAKNFLSQLLGHAAKTRYVHLTGPGGIGKTHFASQLVSWIEEICPHSLHLQELKITALDELEGNMSRPGAFLRVLRNQCHANKKASVVIIDEANWLSDPMFEAAAKRVFNGDQSKLSTSYFGDGEDGTGLELSVPPMLVITASNTPISEAALKTRFDCVTFPNPSDEALFAYAKQLVSREALVKKLPAFFVKKKKISDEYQEKIKTAIKGATNYRDIQSRIPTLISQWESESWGIKKRETKVVEVEPEGSRD